MQDAADGRFLITAAQLDLRGRFHRSATSYSRIGRRHDAGCFATHHRGLASIRAARAQHACTMRRRRAEASERSKVVRCASDQPRASTGPATASHLHDRAADDRARQRALTLVSDLSSKRECTAAATCGGASCRIWTRTPGSTATFGACLQLRARDPSKCVRLARRFAKPAWSQCTACTAIVQLNGRVCAQPRDNVISAYVGLIQLCVAVGRSR